LASSKACLQPSSDDLQTEGFEVYREFVEVETGKGADTMDPRPQLKAKARGIPGQS
jgi:hypothetical protein